MPEPATMSGAQAGAAAGAQPMLELKSVSAGYASFQALFDVSLEVRKGEAVAVIGPNGAGKTTLMRVISGLLPVSSGALSMEGRSLREIAPHRVVETGIAHVPENRRLFPRMTVEENLKIGAFVPKARARYRERLELVYQLFPRMRERAGQMAGTLSGGEQQMCAIGRALMSGPSLLLMDEQNVQQVLKLVDRAYLLEVGTIKSSGTAEELIGSESLRKAYIGI